MAQFKTAMLAGVTLTTALTATAAFAGQTTFSDGTFNGSDYTLGSFKDPSVTVTPFGQNPTGGSSGAGLQGLTTSSGGDVQGVLLTALNDTFVYDPTASGAVTGIDVSLDRYSNPMLDGQQILVGNYTLRLLADQDGTLYQATFAFGPSQIDGGFWVNLSQPGITASQFTVLNASNFATGGSTTGLNFDGDAITFGFAMRSAGPLDKNGAPQTDGDSNDLRADNFRVTVNSADVPGVPEPASWALMIVGFGSAGAVMRARRRGAALA